LKQSGEQKEDCMKFVKLTLAFWMLAVASCTAQNLVFADARYEAPEFSALYPVPDKDKPGVTYSFDNVELKTGGSTKLHNYIQSLHDDSDAFLVIYCDIPNMRSDSAALDHMLDGALGQLDNAKSSPKTNATFGGLPARAVTATGTYVHDQTTFHVTSYERITVKGDRIWQAIVICDAKTICSEADANKFFNSIEIR
jgi:hypothetical protein